MEGAEGRLLWPDARVNYRLDNSPLPRPRTAPPNPGPDLKIT